MSNNTIWLRNSASDAKGGELTATQLGEKRLLDIGLNQGSPPTRVNWDYHHKSVSSNVVTYTFYSGGPGGTLLLTGVLTYVDSSLDDLTSSEWTFS